MNELQIFNSPEFGQVRTIKHGDTVLFCANDVAVALSYKSQITQLIDIVNMLPCFRVSSQIA